MMKYLKVSLTIIVAIAIYFIYLFIPSRIVISGNDNFGKMANDPNFGVLQIQYWDKWMPYQKIDTVSHSFFFPNSRMDVQTAFISSAKSKFIVDEVEGVLTFSALEASNDQTYVRYECVIENRSFFPMTRIQNFQASKKMKKELEIIMQAAKKYYANKK
jgi:hypothetical protein